MVQDAGVVASVSYSRHFKVSDSAIIDAHDPEVFKMCLVQNVGWDADAKHVRFAQIAKVAPALLKMVQEILCIRYERLVLFS